MQLFCLQKCTVNPSLHVCSQCVANVYEHFFYIKYIGNVIDLEEKRISGTYFPRFVASILSTLNECCMQYSFVIFIFCSNYGSVVYINNNSDQFRWNVVEFQPSTIKRTKTTEKWQTISFWFLLLLPGRPKDELNYYVKLICVRELNCGTFSR